MHLALTILAILAVIGVPSFIGYKVGRAVERSRIRAEGRGDIAAASTGGGSDWCPQSPTGRTPTPIRHRRERHLLPPGDTTSGTSARWVGVPLYYGHHAASTNTHTLNTCVPTTER